MKSIELFAGAGGLALGTSACGFKHDGVFELDRNACNTIRHNQNRRVPPVDSWPSVEPTDVRSVNFSVFRDVDLVSGGPPCQPFSIGGKHGGQRDRRNLFPEVVRAVRETKPRAILIENVKGLTRQSFADFLRYVQMQLRFPELLRGKSEQWFDHLARLDGIHCNNRKIGLFYEVSVHRANAADYGVPQRRERVFIVGFRADIPQCWSFPEPSHSLDSLLYSQWVSGEYWLRHGIPMNRRPKQPVRFSARIKRLSESLFKPDLKPWRTVRDAIHDLPNAAVSSRINGTLNHNFNPGARSYKGHTGSPLDEPAKTLKAGDHGVPGGENMLVHGNGKVRYFTIRESARLQTFPDNYAIEGSWTEAMRQLGNAVPVALAQAVAKSIYDHLKKG